VIPEVETLSFFCFPPDTHRSLGSVGMKADERYWMLLAMGRRMEAKVIIWARLVIVDWSR